jgi:hypothetical protein
MRKHTRGSPRRGTEEAELLYFSDKQEEARKLDLSVIYLGIDREATRLAWDRCKERVLAEFIKEHPGCRPWHWWRFDGPQEPRRVMRADVPCEAGFHNKPFNVEDTDFGLWMNWWPLCDVVYESQAAFLKRHNLLAEGEEERANFGPELVRYKSYVPFDHVE